MTEEQLEKKAKEWVKPLIGEEDGGYNENDVSISLMKNAFIAGAHSRDEEIKELKSLIKMESEIREGLLRDKHKLQDELDKLRNPWISVEDNLPDPHTPVYAKNDKRTWFFALRTDNRVRPWYDIVGRHPEEVTHWKPIQKPELKKGE